ncbi:MFS transporter [Deinococcus aetherius]|nr:MFS transporter [Deinococcus aetherius]
MGSSFLVFWLSQTVSVLGSGMTKFAIGILLYQKTGQVSALALSILFGYLPSLFVGPFAGVIVDRYNRRLILLITGFAQAVIGVALLAAVTQAALPTVTIFALLALQSAVGTFQPLTELASVGQMVPKEALARANSLLSMNEDISQVFAPILGGFLVAAVGIQTVLLFDVFSFLVACAALLFIRIPNHERAEVLRSPGLSLAGYMADFRQSLGYLRSQPKLLQLLLIMALLNFSFTITLPLVSPLVLERTGNDTVALGLVTACSGIGAILGGVLVIALLKRKLSIRQVFLLNGFEAVLVQISFGLARVPVLWGAFRFLPGLTSPFANASYQVFWQTAVPQALQGRVFAVRRMLAVSLTPLALVLSGVLSDLITDFLVGQGVNASEARLQSFQSMLVGFGVLSVVLSLAFAWGPTFSQLHVDDKLDSPAHPTHGF